AVRTTRFSGRGVGLDVVKAEVEALHGSIDLQATLGHGCRFTLIVPLTLTAIHALLVRCGGRDFALPSATVTGLVRICAEDIRELPTGHALHHGDRLLPLRFLAPLLGVGAAPSFGSDGRLPVAIVGNAGAEIALVVDALQSETEILVKDLGNRLQGLEFVSGATILEDGEIALILNAQAMARSLDGRPALATALAEAADDDEPTGPAPRLLVADDSVTTRMLLMGVLEEAGFDVTAVPDGMAAWERLQRESFDIVVSDVEMPRMDGFGLTERVRSSTQHRNLPVILVTGLEKEEHRLRGLAVGANAYIVKSGFESHSLLEAIGELV
nr:response regulator [Planctomycetota bacterium]